ncbi:hypothetical protein [Methylobacterium nodulans]|uniref:hypothetical protein n=1 Tax=Methylobacterium nodulans TaxID=114616 RepID=UPI0012ED852E|nr:hypothetical protein [Methylobacterium nodulans]
MSNQPVSPLRRRMIEDTTIRLRHQDASRLHPCRQDVAPDPRRQDRHGKFVD